MPELPEVETTRRGIAPSLEGRRVAGVEVRERRLRWPVPAGLEQKLAGQLVRKVGRRAKYLLIETDVGTALIHLGMSGSLRLADSAAPLRKHDHFDICVEDGAIVRFNDPRRFGSLLWQEAGSDCHPLLAQLGPEPLSAQFDGAYLYRCGRGRKVVIKNLLMNSNIVVGVGNIYASEALFQAGVHPKRAAGRISSMRMVRISDAIKAVLQKSITVGGTTLRDFSGANGDPGYFRQMLNVYGRTGQPCRRCGTPIRHLVLGQRSTFHCPQCQR